MLTYKIVEQSTKRGWQKLIDSGGYTYDVRRRRGDATDWQCTIRGKINPCRARVVQRAPGNFEPGQHHHNHLAEVGAATAARIIALVKTKAMDDVFRPAAAIVDEVYVVMFPFILPFWLQWQQSKVVIINTCNLKKLLSVYYRFAYRNLKMLLVLHCQSQNILLDNLLDILRVSAIDLQNPPAWILSWTKTIYHSNSIVQMYTFVTDATLFFATNEQLYQLTKAKTWYIDGTFKLCRHPFSQLLTINAFVRKDKCVKQVPLLFLVMSGWKKLDYRKVMNNMCALVHWWRLCG